MYRDSGARPRRWRHLEPGFLLILASCSQLLPTSSVAVPPIPAGEARLWFYRDGGPYEIQASPYLRLNGRVAGISEPDAASAVGPALTIGRRRGIYQLMKSRLTSGLALTRPECRQRWFGDASCGHVMLVNIGQPSRCGGVPPG